jgi:hypothetical protein
VEPSIPEDDKVICPNCGIGVKVAHPGDVAKSISDMTDALKDLTQSVGRVVAGFDTMNAKRTAGNF